MSILNVFLTPSRVLICVNTELYQLDKTLSHASKLVPLPHLNAVLAQRGAQSFFAQLFAFCVGMACPDLETLVAGLPNLLKQSWEWTVQYAASLGIADADLVGQQIVLAGWSADRGSMLAFAYEQVSWETGFVCTEIKSTMLSPGDDSLPACERVDRENLVLIARAQQQLLQKLESEPGSGAGGGRLIVAEIVPDRMTILPVCDLGRCRATPGRA